MTIQELRIGNYVLNGFDDLIKVNFISGNFNIAGYRLDTLKPIELTEEWLLKFVFKKFAYNYEFWEASEWSVEQHKNKDSWWLLNCNKQVDCTRINYVHQLQNLYFALTGEELTLNETK